MGGDEGAERPADEGLDFDQPAGVFTMLTPVTPAAVTKRDRARSADSDSSDDGLERGAKRSRWRFRPEMRSQYPLAPSTLDGLMSWASQYARRLDVLGVVKTLVENVCRGINLLTDFSGYGCAEQAAVHVEEGLVFLGHGVERGFRCIRACDAAQVPRQALLMPTNIEAQEQASPCHIFKNVMATLPASLKSELERIHRWYCCQREKLLQDGSKPGGDAISTLGRSLVNALKERLDEHDVSCNDTADCVKHGRACKFFGEPGEAWSDGISMWIAGSVCVDYSAMGKRRGVFGEYILPLVVWLHLAARMLPDVLIHECAPRFPVWILELFLPQYKFLHKVWCPTDGGVPAARPRCYSIAICTTTMIPSGVTDIFTAEKFEEIFFRQCTSTADVFLFLEPTEVETSLRRRACQRGLVLADHASESLSREAVMCPSHLARLDAYKRVCRSRGCKGPWIANLQQSPDSTMALTHGKLPVVTCSSQLYSIERDRYLEKREVMASFLLPVHTWSPAWFEGPRHVFQRAAILDELSFHAAKSLVGNGMSLIQVGAAIMFALCTHVKRAAEQEAAPPLSPAQQASTACVSPSLWTVGESEI